MKSPIVCTTVVLKFSSTKWTNEAYEIHLKDLHDSICLEAYNKERLHEIRIELSSILAHVKNLEERIWRKEQEVKFYAQ